MDNWKLRFRWEEKTRKWTKFVCLWHRETRTEIPCGLSKKGKEPQYESFGDLASREGINFFQVPKVRHTCAVKSVETMRTAAKMLPSASAVLLLLLAAAAVPPATAQNPQRRQQQQQQQQQPSASFSINSPRRAGEEKVDMAKN